MRKLLLAVLLSGCADEYPTVKFEPHLVECPRHIKCHIIEWQLGPTFMAHIGGTHIDCRCIGKEGIA
jgi:hypothetical protein